MKLLPPLCPEPISARRGGAIQGAGRGYTGGGAGLYGGWGYTGGRAELFSGGAGLYRGRGGLYRGRGGAIQGAGRVQENLLSCPSTALIFVYVNVNAP